MEEALRQWHLAIAASDVQLIRTRQAIDAMDVLIAQTTHLIHDSQDLLAGLRPNDESTPCSGTDAPAATVSSFT